MLVTDSNIKDSAVDRRILHPGDSRSSLLTRSGNNYGTFSDFVGKHSSLCVCIYDGTLLGAYTDGWLSKAYFEISYQNPVKCDCNEK